ncbi:hypothetical protein BDZ91DRAFT_711946 [Kalaharituber pfeilii]|nr:hypothetical protein BDZ91DRAFT_711946 [Kalaharituber pfeilii]
MTSIAEEQHKVFLAKLQGIRDNLGALRKDRTVYIRSTDVMLQYDLLCQQIQAVAHLDKDTDEADGLSRIYLLTTDCFLLISLFFLTVGKNNEPPAAFAALVIIKRLIKHLNESGNFSGKDIHPIELKLAELSANIEHGRHSHPAYIIEQLQPLVNDSFDALKPLQEKLARISVDLQPLHEKLVSIRRSIKGCEARSTFAVSEVRDFQHQLEEIEGSKIEGKFLAPDGSEPLGQEIVQDLLEKCKTLANEALERQGKIAPSLRATSSKLMKLKSHLERLSVTQAWSLRETDLYDYIIEVQDIDRSRVNGKFVDTDGNSPEDGQSVLLYLVRKCYMHIFSLVVSSEPVSEALTPIYNQLQTVRRCLVEVQNSGGVSSARELYPYSLKLTSIDNMRVDGKFMVGQDIPEGQGRVTSLLAECFEIIAELRASTEDTP